ncbi:MAG TPA: Gfo/Idh/MocA family oxidoreductase [Puia sp.]
MKVKFSIIGCGRIAQRHAEHTISALQAGFHVLCEKPMALTVQDCSKMIDTAEKAGKQLFIVKQNRFNPPVAALKKLIDEGRLGKIYSVQLNCFWHRNEAYYKDSWKGTKDMDGGTLFTQFSHFIDLLYWIVGDIQEVQGYIGNFGHNSIEFEDTGVISTKFYNGANEMEYQDIQDYKIENLPPGNPPNNYGQYQGSMSNHDKVYQNVIEALQGNDHIAANGFEGLKTVEIIDKIYSTVKQL